MSWVLIWTIIVRHEASFTIDTYEAPMTTAENCNIALAEKEKSLLQMEVTDSAVSFTVRCERK